jgi:hypothetical protein
LWLWFTTIPYHTTKAQANPPPPTQLTTSQNAKRTEGEGGIGADGPLDAVGADDGDLVPFPHARRLERHARAVHLFWLLLLLLLAVLYWCWVICFWVSFGLSVCVWGGGYQV